MSAPPIRRAGGVAGAAIAGALMTACALRLGGTAPEELRVLIASVDRPPPAGATGDWMSALDAEVVLISAAADSVWFASAAGAAGLTLSGPAVPEPAAVASRAVRRPALAFLAWEPLGDTTIALVADDGARILVHDALYRTDGRKALDLMAASLPVGANPRDAARALLTYVATDVMHDAIVVLALRTAEPAAADSLDGLLRPVFAGVAQCEDQLDIAAATGPGMLRLYYSPVVRVRCDAVRGFGAPVPALLARLVLGG